MCPHGIKYGSAGSGMSSSFLFELTKMDNSVIVIEESNMDNGYRIIDLWR